MPLVRTPMIAPTKMYDSFPTISPEEAADLVCEAIRAKPKQINTKLGTFGEVAYALAPKAVDQILHLAYRVFPESTAAKGGKGDGERRQGVGRGDRAGLSDEGRALVVLTSGGLEATFAPEDGMPASRCATDGDELLGAVSASASPDAPVDRGHPAAAPVGQPARRLRLHVRRRGRARARLARHLPGGARAAAARAAAARSRLGRSSRATDQRSSPAATSPASPSSRSITGSRSPRSWPSTR